MRDVDRGGIPTMTNWDSQEGSAAPLGATWIANEEAFNFALYSKYASEVNLLLYSREDVTNPLYEYKFNPLINKSERVWHCRLKASAIAGARYYAYDCLLYTSDAADE